MKQSFSLPSTMPTLKTCRTDNGLYEVRVTLSDGFLHKMYFEKEIPFDDSDFDMYCFKEAELVRDIRKQAGRWNGNSTKDTDGSRNQQAA